jgi:hypothetical protein
MDHVASRLSRLLKLLVRNGADPHEPAVVEVAASFGLTSAMVALHGECTRTAPCSWLSRAHQVHCACWISMCEC